MKKCTLKSCKEYTFFANFEKTKTNYYETITIHNANHPFCFYQLCC